jgi:hypothetical protein
MNRKEKIKEDLKEYGAEINEIKINDTLMFQVRDNGIWGFAESEPDMILTEDELEELHETYIIE